MTKKIEIWTEDTELGYLFYCNLMKCIAKENVSVIRHKGNGYADKKEV